MAVATNRFKKDFGYYFLGIIVPGLFNAAIIPIIKHLLGTQIFGAYSLKFNFLLLLMATLIGGICQSIIRFRVDAGDYLSSFYVQIFLLVRILLVPVAITSFFVFYFWLHETALLSILFSLSIIGGSLQSVLLAISQANFQSKFIMLSEGVRAFVFFLFAIIALSIIKIDQQQILFLCLLLSYLVSIYLLAKKNKLSFINVTGIFNPEKKAFETKAFLMYGFPISLLFAVYYLFAYLDKPLLALNFGLEVQGNYQAMFDIIFRGITALMSPFAIAILPILTQNFKPDKAMHALVFLRKLIYAQIIILFAGAGFYWIVGFKMMANILMVPLTFDYKLSGLVMIVACMVWQIALLNQNPFKLIKRSDLLLKFMFVSLVAFVISLLVITVAKQDRFYFYTFPFLIAGVCYNLLCIRYFQMKKLILR